jgi:hypothetical protein
MSKILITIPIKPTLNPVLINKIVTLIGRVPTANPKHEFTVIYDFELVPKLPSDFTP